MGSGCHPSRRASWKTSKTPTTPCLATRISVAGYTLSISNLRNLRALTRSHSRHSSCKVTLPQVTVSVSISLMSMLLMWETSNTTIAGIRGKRCQRATNMGKNSTITVKAAVRSARSGRKIRISTTNLWLTSRNFQIERLRWTRISWNWENRLISTWVPRRSAWSNYRISFTRLYSSVSLANGLKESLAVKHSRSHFLKSSGVVSRTISMKIEG